MIVTDPVDDIYSGDKNDELFKEFNRVMDEEQRLHLLQSLKKNGLCTRDVLKFLVNQADLKTSL